MRKYTNRQYFYAERPYAYQHEIWMTFQMTQVADQKVCTKWTHSNISKISEGLKCTTKCENSIYYSFSGDIRNLSFDSPHISLSSALVGARLMLFYGRPMPPADGFVPIW